MTLPIDRTTKAALDANLVNGVTSDAPVLKANNDNLYNTNDELYNYISSLVAGGVVSPYPPSNFNKLINGNFDVWQRGTSFNANSFLTYAADRWATVNNVANQASTISRQDGSGIAGSIYCLRYRRNLGATGVNDMSVAHTLETEDSKKLIGNKLTLSFLARIGPGASSSSLRAYIISGTGTDQNVLSGFTGSAVEGSQTIALTTGWQKFTITTTNSFAANKSQIGLQFSYTPTGTAGANDYFEIAQVQVNVGAQALPFQPRSFAEELSLCQRYYEKSYNQSVDPGTASAISGLEAKWATGTMANSQIYGKTPFKVKKRISPTIIIYPYTTPANTGRVSDGGTGADFGVNTGVTTYVGDDGFAVQNNSGASITVSNAIIYHWAADAEL